MNDSEFRVDAYSPAEISARVYEAGITKARNSLIRTLLLGFLGGGFIAIGAMLYLVVMSDPPMIWGFSRLIGGFAFSLGLILILVGGAELFTGNMLIVMAATERAITPGELLRNWVVVFIGNAIGTAVFALLFYLGGLIDKGVDPPVAVLEAVIAAKNSLTFVEALVRGILCNILVCLAVWMSMSCRLTISKIFAIAFPIAAFVALGLEHSIANLFFYPAHMFATGETSFLAMINNLLPVTIGNIVGGGLCVAVVYRVIYPPVDPNHDIK